MGGRTFRGAKSDDAPPLADDRYYGVRMTVLHKAFEVKTPEARAIIRKLTADENERVRDEAKRYQKLLDADGAK